MTKHEVELFGDLCRKLYDEMGDELIMGLLVNERLLNLGQLLTTVRDAKGIAESWYEWKQKNKPE